MTEAPSPLVTTTQISTPLFSLRSRRGRAAPISLPTAQTPHGPSSPITQTARAINSLFVENYFSSQQTPLPPSPPPLYITQNYLLNGVPAHLREDIKRNVCELLAANPAWLDTFINRLPSTSITLIQEALTGSSHSEHTMIGRLFQAIFPYDSSGLPLTALRTARAIERAIRTNNLAISSLLLRPSETGAQHEVRIIGRHIYIFPQRNTANIIGEGASKEATMSLRITLPESAEQSLTPHARVTLTAYGAIESTQREIRILEELHARHVPHIIEPPELVVSRQTECNLPSGTISLPWLQLVTERATPLNRFIHSEGNTPAQQVRIFRESLTGLAAIHNAGYIHRDIKPANMLCYEDASTRFADFGCAEVVTNSHPLRVYATPAYTSPEVLTLMRQQHPTQDAIMAQAADVWALGLTLYQTVIGNAPSWMSTMALLARNWHENHSNIPTQDICNQLLEDINTTRRALVAGESFSNASAEAQNLRLQLHFMLDPDPQTRMTARQAQENFSIFFPQSS